MICIIDRFAKRGTLAHLRAGALENAMTDKAFAQADPDWLALISAARDWLSGPLGQLMLDEERRMLEEELGASSAAIWCITGPAPSAAVAPQVQRNVRLGAPLPGWRSSAKSRPGR
jgi:hypothetical protein